MRIIAIERIVVHSIYRVMMMVRRRSRRRRRRRSNGVPRGTGYIWTST